MGVPRGSYCPVGEIQPDESLTSTSELNLTPGKITCHREAKVKGYWATTKVNVLSPEIVIVSDADTVHLGGRQYSQFRDGEELRDRRGLRQLHGIKWIVWELGRPKTFPKYRICQDKPINGKDWQKMFWESDKFIVTLKQSNVCRAKELTGEEQTLKTILSETMGGRYLFPSETGCSSIHRRRGIFPEEPCEGKLHARFCEGICNVLTIK